MCYENGGMVDDGTVYRLGKEMFTLFAGTENSPGGAFDVTRRVRSRLSRDRTITGTFCHTG